MTLHRSALIKSLRADLPQVEPWLSGYRDNLTLEMMRFRNFTEDAISRGDMSLVRKCFRFANAAFRDGNRHVRNSIVVTYLEHLTFNGAHGREAQALLPAPLATERTFVLEALRKAGIRGVTATSRGAT